MHILKRELRANLKSLLIWSLVMILLVWMMVSEFSAYYNNPEMGDILDAMPETMMKAFGFSDVNLTTTTGFIALASFYFFLMLGVFAVLLGSSIIAKEERDKTAEFFLTLPISREQVILSKMMAAIINCLAINLVTVSAVIATMFQYDLDGKFYGFITRLFIAVFIIELVFLSLGMLLSSVLKRYKSSGKVSAAILMVLYIFSVLSAMTSKLDFLKFITPFKYFDANKILVSESFETGNVILSLVIISVCILGTFLVYPKRDLHL